MKRFIAVIALISAAAFVCRAQEPERVEGYKYVDAATLPLYGKVNDNTSARYERLPGSLHGQIREQLWDLGRNSAGLYIRFRSNSSNIRARWTSLNGFGMNHMTDTGVRGLDLYCIHDGEWRFMGSGRPVRGRKVTDARIVGHMEPEMREYMLYLSLYDGITELEIGVDEDAVIEAPEVNRPVCGEPVVMYGTSILQGGCVSRPGMVHTSIISRKLDREVINLGFSGNARLDPEIAEWMAQTENPALFVLDFAPNSSPEIINEKGEAFFRILRNAHPDVPVIFIEEPFFPHHIFDMEMNAEIVGKIEALQVLFGKLLDAGEKNIYYVPSDDMIGDDGEATVDGTHFTDLGMERYVEVVLPVIEKALAGKK